MRNSILSIDCGTQSLRTLLFSPEGRLIDKVQIHYEPYVSPNPGWAEQDPEIFWNSLCEASQSLKNRNPEGFRTISGVGVTTQRASMINVDEKGTPLRPAIIWLDQRIADTSLKLPFPLNVVLKIAGMEETLRNLKRDGKCNWIRQNQPDVWKNTHKYLQVSGFLNHRLTGTFKDSVASQIGHIPFNYKKRRWCKNLEPASLLFPIEKSKLPETVEPGALIGNVTEKASEATGIKNGTPVISCGSDKGCETLAMGVLDESTASLSFGTTATVQTTTGKYFEVLRFMPPYPAPVPGCYNPEIEIFRGFWMITWFKNEFAHKEVEEANQNGVIPEVQLDNLLRESPPGAMGLVVQPYWGPGLEHPSAKGAMIGFGDVHKKSHVYRAVIEGLAYALLDGLQTIEKKTKTKVKKVTVSGGASQSDEICQISADIFNLPLMRGTTSETSGLGAAIVTSVGAGIHADFSTAIDSMVHYDRSFVPNMNNVRIYKRLYNEVYRKIYHSLEPLYRNMRDITGYPEK